MYDIIVNGQVVSTVILPCYVFFDTILESFCTCDYDKAEAVLASINEESTYCDLAEKTIRHEGFPIATIVAHED